jgi:hypothetical protein
MKCLRRSIAPGYARASERMYVRLQQGVMSVLCASTIDLVRLSVWLIKLTCLGIGNTVEAYWVDVVLDQDT